jgi:putative flippase GtrA
MTADPQKSAPARRPLHAKAAQAGSWIAATVLRILPAPVRRRLETTAGKRFSRFVPVAISALAASQITLAILVGPVQMTAGKAALIASVVGALVSYLLSRWAWDRKGRPDLLRETVPFWLVSFAVWGVLSLTSHYAGAFAKHEHMHHFEKIAVVNGAYLAANCVTFVSRFLIFHYVLFSDRRKRAAAVTDVVQPVVQPADDAPEMALAAEPARPQPKP